MNKNQEQLIKLLAQYPHSVWELEAIHKRCCIYYGLEKAMEMAQTIIDFADESGLGLLESFRLHVEISEMSMQR